MDWVRSWYVRQVAWVVVLGLFIIGAVPARSMAYVVTGQGHGQAAVTDVSRAADMDKVQRVLESKLVAEKLTEAGLTMEEVNERLDRLTDAELHQFVGTLDSLYPGGDAIGVVISILIIVLLVLVILKLTDRKIIIK